jgi:hypothetical protein
VNYTDKHFEDTIARAIRLVAILTAVAVPTLWWKSGWQSALLALIGAVISGSGLWEWRRLMSAIAVRMDLENQEGKSPSMAPILFMFFLRLGLTLVVLYVSLKYLEGSVFALAAGLAMGIFALTFEGVRLLRAGTI